MTMKKMLGLESFSLSEQEIFEKLSDAYRQQLTEIEFNSPEKRVKIKLKQVSPQGITKWYYNDGINVK